MEFRSITELHSCKGLAYEGELVHRAIKIPERDWAALKTYAQDSCTSAGEIVRCLIRDFLAGVGTAPRRGSMGAGR